MASPQPPNSGLGAQPQQQQQQQQHQQAPMGGYARPPQQMMQGRPMPPNPNFQGRPPPPQPGQQGMPMGRAPGGIQPPAGIQQVRPGVGPSPGGPGVRPGMMPPQQQAPRPPMGVAPQGLQNGSLQPRPSMSSMQQQQQGRPPMPGQGQSQQNLAGPMASMNLGVPVEPPGAPPPERGATPAANSRSKRSARAYHQDDAPPPPLPTGNVAGWNDVPHQASQYPQQAPRGQQPAWQAAAQARVAQFENADGAGIADGSLDQIPGQRNTISAEQAAHNHAALRATGGMGAVGQHQQQPQLFSGDMGQQQQQQPQIQQPPHSAGQRFAGPRSKIDPDQIPSPVEAQDADQEFFDREWFATCGRGGLPLSTTDFGAVDQGNCSPKHMRLTTYSMPQTEELANTSQLPLAIVVQPFAQQRLDEAPIPIVECGPSGPPRCKRCRAYINPWAIFVEGGQKWVCNLCGTATEVAADYFCNLDMHGRRVDFDERLELSRGSVEFRVPKEYWAIQAKPPASVLLPVAPANTIAETAKLSPKPGGDGEAFAGSSMGMTGQGGAAAKAATKAASDAINNLSVGLGRTTVRAPRPMTYMFAIDVSFSAARCGSLKASVESIRECLYGPRKQPDQQEESDAGPGFGLPHGSKVIILTFDRALHFYNLLPDLDHAQMLVVPDIDEPFVPLSEGLLADPWESRNVIESLLDNLPSIFAENMSSEAALGAAVRGAQAAMSTIGGQCNIFLSTIPTVGPGALKHREDTKLYGTEKEKQLFAPQDAFYRGVAEECVDAGIGINVWFFPSQYIDVATIGTLCGLTGGDMFFHPRFDPVRDGIKLDAQIKRAILRESGYNATMRIRCSNGLHVQGHFGNFFQRNTTDIELANVDADKAIAASFKHDGKLDEKQEAHFQTAILYTSADGERKVRVHNIAVPVTSLLGNVFRYADLDSTVAYFTKECITLAQAKPLREVRHYLTDKCVKILLAYRRNCASSTSPGQLILPESFKLLPLYALAIIKSKALKGGNVTSDVRTYFMRYLRGLGVTNTMAMCYPRMVALHNMADDDGEPIKIPHQTENGTTEHVDGARIKSPPLLRPSYLRMEGHGAYLVENSDMCLLWLGASVSPRLLEDLYAVNSLEELDPRMTTLPKLPTKLSKQVRALVASFAAQRLKPALPVLIARQNKDGTEVELANNLIEDQNNDAMSYVDYLCHVHRIITSEMSGNTGNSKPDDVAGNAEHHSLWRGW